MLISYNWLKQYLPTLAELDINQVSHKISQSLAEIEQIIPKGQNLKKIVVGEIKEIKDHPISKTLMIAKVDTKDSIRQIVFAKENKDFVKISSLFPVCLPGGQIYNPKSKLGSEDYIQIEAREFQGVLSEGVLCSPKEIGVYDEPKGVSIIGENDLEVGTDLLYLLKDFIFEIENKSLTHRPDCFSHRGIAREISAIMQIELLPKPEISIPIKTSDVPFEIKIQKNDLCRRFTAISATNVHVKPSPTWMQICLSYVGSRPINNIVDISNYVMLDIGYPIHIYDYDKLKTPKLIVRNAKKDEKFFGLNEKTYTLKENMVVVDDSQTIQDLAGILGGSGSEISNQTKNIIIESASWDMYNIRKTAMTLGINTDAAMRFAKGLDSFGTLETVKRVSEFVCDLAEAEIASEIKDIKNEVIQTKLINYKINHIKRHLGIEIPKLSILQILKSLEIDIDGDENLPSDIWSSNTTEFLLKLTIPTFRRDLNINEDITEEIARIYGYTKITPQMPQKSILAPKQNIESYYIRIIRSLLIQAGLDEIYTYTFLDKNIYSKCNLDHKNLIRLKNPLSSDLEYIKNAILPGMIDKVALNSKNFDDIALFEINNISTRNKKKSTQLPDTSKKIAIILSSKNSKQEIFYNLKKVLDFVFKRLKLNPNYQNLSNKPNELNSNILEMFQLGKSAFINIDKEFLGIAGIIHPQVKDNFGLSNLNIAIAELEFDKLLSILKNQQETKYKPLNLMQKAKRDISFWINQRDEVQKIINQLLQQNFPNISNIEMKDQYQIEDKRSITISIILHHPNKTLDEKEISLSISQVNEFIENNLGYSIKK